MSESGHKPKNLKNHCFTYSSFLYMSTWTLINMSSLRWLEDCSTSASTPLWINPSVWSSQRCWRRSSATSYQNSRPGASNLSSFTRDDCSRSNRHDALKYIVDKKKKHPPHHLTTYPNSLTTYRYKLSPNAGKDDLESRRIWGERMNDVMQLCAVANGPGGKRRRTETLDELT